MGGVDNGSFTVLHSAIRSICSHSHAKQADNWNKQASKI